MISAWTTAMAGVVQRDALVFASYRTTLISRVLSAILGLLIFYYVSRLVRVGSFGGSGDYFAFVAVGLVILQVLTATLATGPTAVRQELVAGTFERFLVSPFGAVSGVISVLVFPLLLALLVGTIMIVAADALFGLPVQWSTVPLALPAALLGSLAFVPFALIFVAAVVAFKQAMTGSQFVVAGLAIIGGLYFPVGLLPDWVQPLSHVQPFTPAADLMRHLIVGAPLDDPWLAVAKLGGCCLVLLPLGIWLLSASVRRGQRRGTIIEY